MAKMLAFLRSYSERREKAEEKLKILKEMNDEKSILSPFQFTEKGNSN